MATLWQVCALVAWSTVCSSVAAIEPTTPYPGRTTPGTAFVTPRATWLGTVNDPDWFRHNIPFLDVPDAQIQEVYNYRWQTYKEHLVYTSPVYGWLSNEFLQPVFYGAPYGGISAAAGHHIHEGRWLRNQQYVKDNIHYWLNGPGQFPKPMNYALGPDTSDWAHEYSFWAASSVWQFYLVTGDRAFAVAQLPQLVRQYRGWDNHFNAELGLYWQAPVWDATEFTPASYESPDGDVYHGGHGYRPTINAYQYGDARAIARIAALAGDTATAADYDQRANALQAAVQARLWDPARQFHFHMHRDSNPQRALLGTRELQGYVPWMFNMPPAANAGAMAHLLDPQGFRAPFGPTTVERRSRWFNHEVANGCCRWTGPSWPFQTSQVLTGVANLLIDYPFQNVITPADYVDMLRTYAATQYRNGVPYIAEAHDPDRDTWLYDGHNHSEDYNHSTYIDNVISGLVGFRGQPDNRLRLKPLAPSSWAYFALENVPYHGRNVTVLWDRSGSRYGQGAGFHVYVDGQRVHSQAQPGDVTLPIGAPIVQDNVGGLVNVAVNSQRHGHGPQPLASYTSPHDSPWNGIDGVVYRTGIPQNSRWTSYATTSPTDSFGVDFRRNVTLHEVRLTFYDDGGGVRTPGSYDLQHWNGSAWVSVPQHTRAAPSPLGNAVNRITFPALTTAQLRVVAPNAGGGVGWGLSELQAMARPVFKVNNVHTNKMLAVQDASRAEGAQVQQFSDVGSSDHLWELVDGGGGFFKLRNVNSGLVLGVDRMQTTDSALIKQALDNGTPDHLWTFIDAGGGQFKVRNRHSGRLLAVSGMSLADRADITQFSDNGTPDHLWRLLPANDPR